MAEEIQSLIENDEEDLSSGIYDEPTEADLANMEGLVKVLEQLREFTSMLKSITIVPDEESGDVPSQEDDSQGDQP